jgi:DNA-binding PadR family transcriptional regulator
VAKRRKLSNPLALAVMTLLGERPMHPYEVAQVLRQRGKEHSIKIHYGSLYTVVQNLEKHGFVEVTGTQRQGNRPERTLYGLTDAGRAEAHDWLADLLAVPVHEFPRFESALSLMGVLPVEEVLGLLEQRARQLDVRIAGVRGALEKMYETLPRVFLVENEYQARMMEAEASYVRGLIGEIADGTLSGVEGWRAFHETGEMPAQWADLAGPEAGSGPPGAGSCSPGADGEAPDGG